MVNEPIDGFVLCLQVEEEISCQVAERRSRYQVAYIMNAQIEATEYDEYDVEEDKNFKPDIFEKFAEERPHGKTNCGMQARKGVKSYLCEEKFS